MKHNDENSYQHDFDWFMRFYEIVGNISDEKVQEIWAQIMAGEISSPHSYSSRTIDVLKNIGKTEAELFSNILSHCVVSGHSIFLPNYEGYLEKCGISYSQIMKLSEHDLIYNDATLVLNFSITEKEEILFVNGKYILIICARKENVDKVTIKQFPLTTVGKELATLIEQSISDDDFISFAKELALNKNINIQVHEIIKVEGNTVEYKKENIIE